MEVHKKLSGLDSETRTLVEIFSMADGDKLPDVEVVVQGLYSAKDTILGFGLFADF